VLAVAAPSAADAGTVVELVERAASVLAGAPAPADSMERFLRRSPFTGAANPLAPPLHPRVGADGVVEATVELGELYEGPPGHVHGGVVAALFDEVLGFAESLTEQPGMTGRLTVAYRAPTPLHVPLQVRGWVERVEGRRILARGTLDHEGRRCAEAEGLFVRVSAERFTELGEQGRRRRDR
jgi:acyl-coenzyme A thioesterase PaaI-like protein